MTRNKLTALALFIATGTMLAQPVEKLGPVSGRPASGIPMIKKKTAALVTLPFFDDFSYRQHIPDTALWEDANVYVNYTYPIAPPTLGTATFDGLDRFGRAYEINNLNTDTADVLTSRPIDLSIPVDSVYLSFFWQAGGYGESPETNDSLSLLFYNPQSNSWQSMWKTTGMDSTTRFEQVMIAVPSIYHKSGFQFKFMAFGASAGNFDVWNIDYVRLDDERNFNDTLFNDVAFTAPHPSLLLNFESIPWFHYSGPVPTNLNKQNLILNYRRNRESGTLNLDLGVYEISSGGNILAADPAGDFQIDNNHIDNVETVYSVNIADFSLPQPPTAEFEITAYQAYSGTNPLNNGTNDTIVKQQIFKNYYAVDDGSAERAYLVTSNSGGFILSKFDINDPSPAQPDSIMGLYIYFMPSEYNIELNKFNIVIYSNNGGIPGTLIYESDSLYSPRYTDTDFYLPYVLDTVIPAGQPLFVGIKQQNNTPLTFGFDVNSGKKTTHFFGTITDFYESSLDGNIMMRPFLQYLPHDIGLAENVKRPLKFEIYPNPASASVNIDIPANEKYYYTLFSISGQMVQQGVVADEISFNDGIHPGLYLLHLTDLSGKRAPAVQKLVIER